MLQNVIDHLNNIYGIEWKEGEEFTFSVGEAVVAAAEVEQAVRISIPHKVLHDGEHLYKISVGGDDEVYCQITPVRPTHNINTNSDTTAMVIYE